MVDTSLLNVFHDDEHFDSLGGGHFNGYSGIWSGEPDQMGAALTESLEGILPKSPIPRHSYYAKMNPNDYIRTQIYQDDLHSHNGLPMDIFESSSSSSSSGRSTPRLRSTSTSPVPFNIYCNKSVIKEVETRCLTPSVEIIPVDPNAEYNSSIKSESESSDEDCDDVATNASSEASHKNESSFLGSKFGHDTEAVHLYDIYDEYDYKIATKTKFDLLNTSHDRLNYASKQKRPFSKSISLPQSPHPSAWNMGPTSASFEDLVQPLYDLQDLGNLDLSPIKRSDCSSNIVRTPGKRYGDCSNNDSASDFDVSFTLSPIKNVSKCSEILTNCDAGEILEKDDLELIIPEGKNFDLAAYITADDYLCPPKTPEMKNDHLPLTPGRGCNINVLNVSFERFSDNENMFDNVELNSMESKAVSDRNGILNKNKIVQNEFKTPSKIKKSYDSEEESIDVETITGSPNINALLHQFEAIEKKKSSPENYERLSSLNGSKKLRASVLPPAKGQPVTRMHHAGAQLSRNKLLSLVIILYNIYS